MAADPVRRSLGSVKDVFSKLECVGPAMRDFCIRCELTSYRRDVERLGEMAIGFTVACQRFACDTTRRYTELCKSVSLCAFSA